MTSSLLTLWGSFNLQLEKQIIQLQEDLKREGEEKISLQKERDKIRELWQNSKKSLEETKVELWNQQRQREEAAECQRMEITVRGPPLP